MIRHAQIKDLNAIDALSLKVIHSMRDERIFQWDISYPRKTHFEKDIRNQALYIYEDHHDILGVMALYEEHETAYQAVDWFRKHSLVIHRILVDPTYGSKGIASKFIQFANLEAKNRGYDSIKIDTYPANFKMRNFLKQHQFCELEYITSMHRIGFERLNEQNRMKRILIFGASGTGKTTLSKMLGEKLGIPYLHLDTIYWERDWTSITHALFAEKVRTYLKNHDRFVIDGNYTNSVTFAERVKIADTIIILDYPIHEAIKGIINREKAYKHRFRSDMATGCIEKIDQEFLKFVYHYAKKLQKIQAYVNHYQGQKKILRFTSRKRLMEWFETL
jgi:adenylate kinase family enzyme/ribosomal protein S18 acetylase RimI-like enzyme